jgi:exonuclease III
MTDLRPADSVGDVWTYFYGTVDGYSRFDYFFVSKGMFAEVVREQTRVVRDPLMYEASDHRPVIAVFRSADQ